MTYEWKPIKTAPRNTPIVLGWWDCSYGDETWRTRNGRVSRCWHGLWSKPSESDATHWKYPPPPPNTEEKPE